MAGNSIDVYLLAARIICFFQLLKASLDHKHLPFM